MGSRIRTKVVSDGNIARPEDNKKGCNIVAFSTGKKKEKDGRKKGDERKETVWIRGSKIQDAWRSGVEGYTQHWVEKPRGDKIAGKLQLKLRRKMPYQYQEVPIILL